MHMIAISAQKNLHKIRKIIYYYYYYYYYAM